MILGKSLMLECLRKEVVNFASQKNEKIQPKELSVCTYELSVSLVQDEHSHSRGVHRPLRRCNAVRRASTRLLQAAVPRHTTLRQLNGYFLSKLI